MTGSTVYCPGCGVQLQPDGVAVVNLDLDGPGEEFAVYQCGRCKAAVEMFGERMILPLTFAIGSDGQAFDPADPDKTLDILGPDRVQE